MLYWKNCLLETLGKFIITGRALGISKVTEALLETLDPSIVGPDLYIKTTQKDCFGRIVFLNIIVLVSPPLKTISAKEPKIDRK